MDPRGPNPPPPLPHPTHNRPVDHAALFVTRMMYSPARWITCPTYVPAMFAHPRPDGQVQQRACARVLIAALSMTPPYLRACARVLITALFMTQPYL